MNPYTAWGLTLIAVAWLIILGTVAALWIQHVMEEREAEREEAAIQRAEADWREWFDRLPEAQKMAGAQRLLDAVEGECGPRAMWGPVSETPIHDGVVVDMFRGQLDDGRQS